jgi:hypothetical protein
MTDTEMLKLAAYDGSGERREMTTVRRKRSELTHADAVKAVSKFASTIKRFCETDEGFVIPNAGCGLNEILVKILASGSFGAASDFFEGLRVLGGHKLPAKEKK